MKKQKWRTHKVIQETKDAVTIIFDTGYSSFVYQAGQYLSITCVIDGERLSRSYSFSSAPSDKFPAITVKRIPNGKMSNYLVDMANFIGEWDIEAPFGNFVLEPWSGKVSETVLMAGGSGISPLFSMLKNLETGAPKPLLLYANKTPDDTIFRRELEEMQNDKLLNAFYAFSAGVGHETERGCIEGRFSPAIIQTVIRQHVHAMDTAQYFICGPADLMQLYMDALLSMNVPGQHIHTEYFDPIVPDNAVLETDNEYKEILVSYFESYYVNEEPQTYECTSLVEVQAGQSILDALVDYDIRVPKSCLKGTCGSCWATKEDGRVQMVNNYALTDADVAEGKILLCQSFPLDQSVSVVIG